jgi:hypothetical protein
VYVFKKDNVTVSTLGTWDDYSNANIDQALPRIYKRAHEYSARVRGWYWVSIGRKRRGSIINRALSFALLAVGAVLPLLATVPTDESDKLLGTQLAVASLALAGLLQAMDKIFGWSSGWLRYITTVTAMEGATRRFDLTWASYIIDKGGALGAADRKPLFDLAKDLETEISGLQAEETDKWVVEFNSSVAMLGDLIKSQREFTDKTLQAAHAALEKQRTEQAEQLKAQALGAIELAIKHKAAAVPVVITIDDQPGQPHVGTSWARMGVPPGQHKVSVSYDDGFSRKVEKVAIVPAGAVARLDIDLS